MNFIEVLEKATKECYSNEDSVSAMLNIYEKICEICDIDKLSVVLYNVEFDRYVTTCTYTYKSGFIFSAEHTEWNIDEYLNLTSNEFTDAQKKFRDLFNLSDNNYLYLNDFNSIENIKDIMKEVGFKYIDAEKISEIYISSVVRPNFFTYCVFERYNSEENLSSEQLQFMGILRGLISYRMNKMIDDHCHHREIASRDSINTLLSQRVPMAVVDNKNHKILHLTELFSKAFPKVKLGDDAKELKELNDATLEKTMFFKLANNKEVYLICVSNNVSRSKFDTLTEAILYDSFEEHFDNFIKNSPIDYALCSLDIDKFKYVNSMFGYSVGDNVLKKISEVIHNFVNPNEIFCRMGEDKFCIFLSYKNELELHSKLNKLSKSFENMRDTHFSEAKITVVMGITLVDKSASLNTLVDQSTTARKSAKGSHKNKFSYYDVEWDLKLQKEIEIEEQIPNAIANDEFSVFLQPKFNLNTKEICGAEALVRWITPKGMIFPDQFIPLFEKNGFIITLDFIVYEKVMKYMRECFDEGLPVYPISVNVSRNHVRDEDFIDKFMSLIIKYNIPNKYLELEVTESTFIEDRAELKSFIDKIKEQNLKVSIDDFGTAYSSLQTLTDINIDILKIDKGFLDNIGNKNSNDISKDKDKILIKNIINLANELDFTGLCEGVETDEQIEFLKEIGCDLGQGYVFAKPMSTADYHREYINNKK